MCMRSMFLFNFRFLSWIKPDKTLVIWISAIYHWILFRFWLNYIYKYILTLGKSYENYCLCLLLKRNLHSYNLRTVGKICHIEFLESFLKYKIHKKRPQMTFKWSASLNTVTNLTLFYWNRFPIWNLCRSNIYNYSKIK